MTELYAILGEMIGEELGVPPIALSPETELEDLPGWDSVTLAGLLTAIESRFGVVAGRQQVEGITTGVDLARLCSGT